MLEMKQEGFILDEPGEIDRFLMMKLVASSAMKQLRDRGREGWR
jgi:hypothetical protein